MSLWSSLSLDTAIIGSLVVLAAASVGTITAKRTMKAVFMLLIVALATAALIGLMGYAYLAAFYVVVYAGTAIALLAFIVMMVGDLYEETAHRRDLALLSVVVAATLEAPMAVYAVRHPVASTELAQAKYSLADAARFFTGCWLCTILMMITIAAVLIEAVSVARKSQESGASTA